MAGHEFLWEYTMHAAVSGPTDALEARLSGIGAGAPNAAIPVHTHEQVFRAGESAPSQQFGFKPRRRSPVP